MGTYEDLVKVTAETVLEPGQPMRIDEMARMVTLRLYAFSRDEQYPPVEVLLLELLLRADPARFVEVAPGVWMRRGDGPEAGVPAKPRRSPFAGSAAAAVPLPEHQVSVDAVGGAGAKVSLAES